jgi:nucleoside-diphosphate kinase
MKFIPLLTLLPLFVLHVGLPAQASNHGATSPSITSTSIFSSSTNGVTTPYTPSKPDELRKNQKIERTLSILKPDALKNHHIGNIISRFEDAGLHIAALKMIKLTPEQVSEFYKIHRDRPFYPELVKFISSGPIVAIVLEGNNAVNKNRQLMGATDPNKAEKGTIRADYAESVSRNSVHGSDSLENANQEIEFFFQPNEIFADH